MMTPDNKIELHIPSMMGFEKVAMECAATIGSRRFLASIEEGRELGVDKLLEKLLQDVMQFVGKTEQHDDLTAVVVRVE
jgi:hypothetical protein